MKDLKNAVHLLTMAKRDLKALRGMERNFDFFDDEVFGFHAQQAVEKSFKAWLSIAGVRYPKVHDLKELSERLLQQGETIPEKFHALLFLSSFAVQLRYDVLDDLEILGERVKLTAQVEALIEHVENLVER